MKSDKFEDVYALTPTQHGVLFHTLYAPESGVYVFHLTCKLRGDLDTAAFRRAWAHVVDTYPVLRSAFVWRRVKEPKQVVARAAKLDIEELDWTDAPSEEQEQRFETLLAEDRRRGFQLNKPPLMRLKLIRMAPDAHRLLWSEHHLLLDGWSLQIVLSEVLRVYLHETVGGVPSKPKKALPFGDYVRWIGRQDKLAAERAWKELLRGFERPNRIQVGHARHLARGHEGEFTTISHALSEELAISLRDAARRLQVTENTLYQGAWALVLSAYTGDEDIVFGGTVSGRPATLPGIEAAVGMFVNTLPVRVRVHAHREMEHWLRELQAQQTELGDFHYASLTDVRRWSDVVSGESLFETMLVYENYPKADDFDSPARKSSVVVEEVWSNESINYPLTLVVSPRSSTLRLAFDRQRFDEAMVRRLVEHLVSALSAVGRDGAKVGEGLRLPEPQRKRELGEFNASSKAVDVECAHHHLERWAAAKPSAVAVVDDTRQLTYGALNRRANQLARLLRTRNVGRGTRVGILLDRSVEHVISLLAVLKSGAAFVPLDPGWPSERLRFVAEDGGLAAVMTTQALSERLTLGGGEILRLDLLGDELARVSGADLNIDQSGKEPAYAIWTSGSTGRPKAVVLAHKGLVNISEGLASAFEIGEDSRVLQFASVGFDGSVGDIFSTLAAGAVLWLATKDATVSATAFVELLRRGAITNVTAPPTFVRLVPPDSLECVRTVACVGEACPVELVERWQEGRRLINGYGPSETTVGATGHVCTSATEAPPIGVPFQNVRVYVLNDELEPVPIGVVGELYIAGAGVAIAYHGRPGLTAESFVPDPFASTPGERMYATGDFGRRREDGSLEFVGRRDEQVKVRGHRIELREVEDALSSLDGILQCAVVVHELDEGLARLVGFVVASPGANIDSFRDALAAKLPGYMIPASIIGLDEMPRNTSGKIDRARLSARADERRAPQQAEIERDLTETEEKVMEIWKRVLRKDAIGVRDDFFEVAGGDSLMAVRMISEVEKALGTSLNVSKLFENPTIERLSAFLDGVDPPAPASEETSTSVKQVSFHRPMLDTEIVVPGDIEAEVIPGQRPFLTGPTGFLGAHLLSALLSRAPGPIHCLVRASDEAHAIRRIKESFTRYELSAADLDGRVVPIVGDLTKSRMGLSGLDFERLAGDVDVIFHNAALVNFIFPPERLFPHNVHGVQEVLRLAATARLKPVHHFSTPGAFPFDHGGSTLLETDAVPVMTNDKSEWITTYAQSKWAAEVLLGQAIRRGIPTVMYRISHIGGSARTGATHPLDALMILLQTCIRMGAAPEVPLSWNVSPVEFVVSAVLELATQSEALGRTFHLNGPTKVELQDVVETVREMGYPIELVSAVEWMDRVQARGKADTEHGRVAALFEATNPGVPARVLDTSHAASSLEKAGVVCPPIDAPMVRACIGHLVRKKILSASSSERE